MNSFLCLDLGWYAEPISISNTMAWTYRRCSKSIIKTWCDWTQWSGDFAELFEDCEDTSPATVTIYNFKPITATLTTFLLGSS